MKAKTNSSQKKWFQESQLLFSLLIECVEDRILSSTLLSKYVILGNTVFRIQDTWGQLVITYVIY